jgi:toxin ParE1/3/4
MSRFILSPRARGDLDDIWSYTRRTWGVRQAELYIRTIQAAVNAVADEPQLAKSCEHVRKGYFRYPAGSHMLFFRLSRNGIDVVRILHRKMDFKRHL